MSELYDILVETPPTKVILLALDQGLWDCERSLNELAALCEANHMEAVASVTQKRQTPETGIVLGSGKLEEASAAAGELGAECAVFDGELTGSQIRNISTALGGMEVIDRTMLILEIFRSRAVTNEGKLQTELALLRYRLPRLQGMGESLSRQGGGGGGGGGARRGAGETKLELDRRHVHARIDALAEKLAEMEKRRGESRKARAKTGMPVVSLVGYTNVGKSSLMNALCGPSVAEADMLFATLDPTSRKLVLPSGMAVLLVDTVGFVSRLPHNLVEAFKSTLEEAAWSDVIVRVADAGDDQREEQLAVTDEVLDGLDCADIPRLTVYNKCDKPNALNFDPDILLTSAKTGYGLDALLKKLDELLSDRVHTIRVLLPYDKLGLAAPMRERGSVQVEEYRLEDAEVVLTAYGISARICKSAVELLRAQGVKAGLIRPITLWPFPEAAFARAADHVKAFLTVEMSAGQMVEDVRLAVAGRKPVYFQGTLGGFVPTTQGMVEEVLRLTKGRE